MKEEASKRVQGTLRRGRRAMDMWRETITVQGQQAKGDTLCWRYINKHVEWSGYCGFGEAARKVMQANNELRAAAREGCKQTRKVL
jgi:hypothetical protein